MSPEELAVRIRARLDEIESEAKDAEGARWYFDYIEDEAHAFFDRWTPSSALRRVERDRRVVDRCAAVLDAFNDPMGGLWPDVTRREKSHAYATLEDLADGLGIDIEERP